MPDAASEARALDGDEDLAEVLAGLKVAGSVCLPGGSTTMRRCVDAGDACGGSAGAHSDAAGACDGGMMAASGGGALTLEAPCRCSGGGGVFSGPSAGGSVRAGLAKVPGEGPSAGGSVRTESRRSRRGPLFSPGEAREARALAVLALRAGTADGGDVAPEQCPGPCRDRRRSLAANVSLVECAPM
mmetsp:Transcript_37655/g.111743  ORF Transcript_37655/g.111743 Transcript_37655/m.111743 type:complete len:186 (+) Transcript_37655:958-1515(+)